MNSDGQPSGRPRPILAILGLLGVVSLPLLWYGIAAYQINITRYKLQYAPGPVVPSVWFFSLVIFAAPLALTAWAAAWSHGGKRIFRFFDLTAPLVLAMPGVVYWAFALRESPNSVFDSVPEGYFCGFLVVLLSVTGAAWTAYRSGAAMKKGTGHGDTNQLVDSRAGTSAHWAAVLVLLAAIAALTLVHVRIQQNFFNHFMFGHADIGHFTEELKNALAGRGLRSDSFENTRLGWHFVPLMYILVPGYAIWPSITYLMTLGPLVLHLAVLPVYWFVHRRSQSIVVALVCAAAWLLLPSVSRLVYSNTYGFAWLYTSVPVLALLLGAAVLQRWKLCWVLVAILLLSRETNTAITLGFGLYIALFTPRRKAGAAVVAISVAYAILCAAVIIPYFAKAGRYERLDIFGALGNSIGELALSALTKPDIFFGRLIRAQSINFLLLVLGTMFFLPLRGWRLAIAALPAIVVHLLMQNEEWISIKFWHHALVLPILFFAALSRLTSPAEATEPTSASKSAVTPGRKSSDMGIACALLVAAAWGHYFFGFSPLSKAYEPYARDSFLQSPDPRLAFVEKLREQIPRDKTILASERLAAHFTDYKRIYTGGRVRPVDYIIVDLSDQWDTSGLRDRAAEFANSGDYEQIASERPIVVLARRPTAPPSELEP